jgi:hypothetical protein
MTYVATVREDMVIGKGTGGDGIAIPSELSSLPLDRLRFDGQDIIDGATISDWFIDALGAKRLQNGSGRQALTCEWDDVLEKQNGSWVVIDALKASLKGYAASKRAGVMNAGCTVTVSGSPLKVWADTQTQTALTALSVQASSNPALTTVWKCRDGFFVTLTAAGIASLASGVMAFVQSAFATEADVVADIDASSITTTAEIDAASWPAN